MNKLEGIRTKYYVQWDTHARHMCTLLCSLMEHQSLVDLAICCGTNTIHAHKCILAANSPYFREQLEKNTGTEQIVITGLDFVVVKSIIEFMYCGETNILDDNLKYIMAAAKFFQMRGLQTLVSDNQDLRYESDSIHIPPPTFLPKKPKYPNAYRPLHNATAPPLFDSYKTSVQGDSYVHRKIKRKFVRSEAEKACAKEAAASRLALEALQKELASTAQMSSFVIEESCTETTVENFIPHSEETFIENLNHIDGVPLQVVNYGDLNGSILTANQVISINKSDCTAGTMPFGIRTNTTKDKLKRILGSNLSNNIEIMYRTNEGDIVNVTADVLQNLSGDALQYQIVDEHGQIRELREFQNNEQNCCSSSYETTQCVPPSLGDALTEHDISDNKPFISTQNGNYVPCSNLEILNSNEGNESSQQFEILNDKLENTNQIFPNIINPYNQNISDNHNNVSATTDSSESEIDIINSSPTSSQKKLSNDTILSNDKMYEANLFADILSKPKETSHQTEENTVFNRCDVNRFLNLNNIILEECKEDKCLKDETECKTPTKGNKKRVALKKPNILGIRKLRTMTADNNINGNFSLLDQDDQIVSECEMKDSDNEQKSHQAILANIDLTSDNVLDIHMENLVDDDKENDSSDFDTFKKIKFTQICKSSVSNLDMEPIADKVQILDNVLISETHSSRKTRSSLKTTEDNIYQGTLNECKEAVGNDVPHMKYDKPRRIMPNRKKKSN